MAIPPVFLPGQTVPADKLQALGSQVEAYTPALTAATDNPTLGAGHDADGMWTQQGHLAMVWWSLQFGTSGVDAGDGIYFVSLPVPVAPGALTDVALGAGRVVDASDATSAGSELITLEMRPGNPDQFRLAVEGGIFVTHASPWAWAANDRAFGYCCYPGDFT